MSKTLLLIDDSRCRICRRCLAQQACKIKAIVQIDRDDYPFIDVHRCYGCKVCMLECPFNAVVTALDVD